MRVQVYRNLQNGMLSLKDPKTGKVLGHAAEVELDDVTCVVRQAGRKRVLREGQKNVHAFMYGMVTRMYNFKSYKHRKVQVDIPSKHQRCTHPNTEVVYNPYKYEQFVDTVTQQPVLSMLWASIESDGFIMGCVDKGN